jgi:hypothetical protein
VSLQIMSQVFSDYIVYADESGDHSLEKIDSQYPVFVLTLCIFRKDDYVSRVVPSIQRLKFKWFGHDAAILHEREIRKQEAPFQFLANAQNRSAFMADVDSALLSARMKIAAAVIDKRRLRDEHLFHDNPYSVALLACLETVWKFLETKSQVGKTIDFVFECRGKLEDRALELEFLRIVGGHNRFRAPLTGMRIRLVDKKANSSGLQIADLTARPIGIKTIRPQQSNRAFDIIEKKLLRAYEPTRRKPRTIWRFP